MTSLTVAELRSSKEATEDKEALSLIVTHNPKHPLIIEKVKQELKFLNNSTRIK